MQLQVDWDELSSQLPKDMHDRFERVLRRSLKRRIARMHDPDGHDVPEQVVSQAVCAWRRRYMKGASKSAKRRMNHRRLCAEATYREIERDLARRYWEKRSVDGLPSLQSVDRMAIAEACEAYRTTQPRLAGSSMDGLMREVLSEAYAQADPAGDARESMAACVLEVVRKKRLSAYVRTSRRAAGRGRGMRQEAFDLYDVVDEGQVAERVRDTGLVLGILADEFAGQDLCLVARGLMVREVARRPEIATLLSLVGALHGCTYDVGGALARVARHDAQGVVDYLLGREFLKRVAAELLRNPHYGRQYRQAVELRLRVRENVPQTPMEAYPLARTMRRHVTLHVGPTNSGKTHDALQALARAESGAYLGPLRLLAYEQFEALNHMGCVCTLLTGEEAVELAGARHVSSTVEMADYRTPIDVAVIDEAQMIADRQRGHNWTEAILGVPAREIHVCCAPHAERVVRRLVELCDDDLRIVRHERLVPLKPEAHGFHLPEDVLPGDALVVFSRRSVHSVAAQLSAAGLRPSLIYGALPHDVRHEEARRFDEGETDVVVATDAIGMGMNLPIRRIVFVEQEKFDGVATRPLRPEEVQQIAGRAGRFGRYDVGYYQSTRLRKDMVRRYEREVPSIEEVPVGLPANIALVRDATLTDCIRQWMALEQPEPFRRIGVERDLALIGAVERRLSRERRTNTDDKLLALSLATMAFDERDKDLYRAWTRMVEAELEGSEADLPVPEPPDPEMSLLELERRYRYCDLLYGYARTFGYQGRAETLTGRRSQISREIMTRLASAGSRG